MRQLATVLNGDSSNTGVVANSSLVLGSDGHLYGVSRSTYNGPRIYKCRTEANIPTGTARLTTAAGFPGGANLRGGLVALPDGKLYGTYDLGIYGVIYCYTPAAPGNPPQHHRLSTQPQVHRERQLHLHRRRWLRAKRERHWHGHDPRSLPRQSRRVRRLSPRWRKRRRLPAADIAGSGTFSTALTLGATRVSFRGRIDANGNCAAKLAGNRTVTLRTEADGSLAGTLTDGERTLTFAASAPHSGAPTQAAGEYTLLFRPANGNLPAGIGHGQLVLKPDGLARLAGWLGDGTAFSATAVLDAAGELPLYITLDRAPAGSLAATVRFADLATTDCGAEFTWTRPPNTSPAFPAGFDGTGVIEGSRFAPASLRYSDPASPVAGLSGVFAGIELPMIAGSAGWTSDGVGASAKFVLQSQLGLIRGFVLLPTDG